MNNNMIKQMMDLYNITEDELKPQPKLIVLKTGESAWGKFKGMRKIVTRFGERTVLDLETKDGDIAILVTHKGLAREFIKVYVENKGLEGKEIRIVNKGKQGYYYVYQVEVLKPKNKKAGKK